MNDIIFNLIAKEAEGSESLEVGDLKPTDATEKPGIKVKLDESTSDVPAKPEDVSEDEEKSAEALSADEKAPVKVKAEASPETEKALNNTDSAATAEEMAKTVANDTDDYVTEGSDTKADESSSLIQTKRESQAPMNKDSAKKKQVLAKVAAIVARNQRKAAAKKSILMKLAISQVKASTCGKAHKAKRGQTTLYKDK